MGYRWMHHDTGNITNGFWKCKMTDDVCDCNTVPGSAVIGTELSEGRVAYLTLFILPTLGVLIWLDYCAHLISRAIWDGEASIETFLACCPPAAAYIIHIPRNAFLLHLHLRETFPTAWCSVTQSSRVLQILLMMRRDSHHAGSRHVVVLQHAYKLLH